MCDFLLFYKNFRPIDHLTETNAILQAIQKFDRGNESIYQNY